MNEHDLANFFTPPDDLDHYRELVRSDKVSITISRDEAAAAICAYDYGVENLEGEPQHQLDCLLASIKEQIHP